MPDFNAPLVKERWPQDGFWTPPGLGQMPEVNRLNVVQTIREDYALSGRIIVPNNTIRTVSSLTGDDGDFWVVYMVLSVYSNTGTVPTTAINQNNFIKIGLQDIRSGYDMFYPYLRVPFLQHGRPQGSLYLNQNIPLQVAIPQPYCFTRTGGARWTFDASDSALGDVTIFYQLAGWKEYANASR